MDCWTPWRREILRHCLWMAAVDPDYAKWAAHRYERESGGVLIGLGAKVEQAIAKREAAGADHHIPLPDGERHERA